ncbi:unnamed protein product [Scytosiphon promiscuus]
MDRVIQHIFCADTSPTSFAVNSLSRDWRYSRRLAASVAFSHGDARLWFLQTAINQEHGMDEKHDRDEASMSSGDGVENGVCGDAQQGRSDDPADVNIVRSLDASGRETNSSDASVPCDHSSSGPNSPPRSDALGSASSLPEPQPDITTMEQAICTGDPGEISALLSGLDKISAVKQLTGCYGGRPSHERINDDPVEDGHGLFRMTNPLLHAAHTGITSIFSAVHGAMQDKLRARQVKMEVREKDESSRSILMMAVVSKNKDMFEAALATLEQHLTKDEVNEMMTSMGPLSRSGEDENNVLDWAARSGCKDLFEAALAAVRTWLTQQEVGALMTHSARGPWLRSRILESAAASGDEDTWHAVLTALLTTEMKGGVTSMEPDEKESVLKSAIRSGSVGTFVTVLADVNGHPLLEEVHGRTRLSSVCRVVKHREVRVHARFTFGLAVVLRSSPVRPRLTSPSPLWSLHPAQDYPSHGQSSVA